MRRKSKIVIVSTIVAVAALLTPIIGPFTFYEAVVPILGRVLPKPDGVPNAASASYNWKGFGLFWSWDQTLPSGCAKWGAAADQDYYNVRLVTGQKGCDSASLLLSHASHSDHIVFGEGGDWVGGELCPFTISTEQIEAFERLVHQAKEIATPEIEVRALRRIELRLERVNGEALTTNHTGGCNDLDPADYGKS